MTSSSDTYMAALSLAGLSSQVDTTPPPLLRTNSDCINDACSAKEFCKLHENSYRVIFAMAIGLKDQITKKPIADYDNDELFMKRKDKKKFKPTLTDLVNEVKRRKVTNGDTSCTRSQGKKDCFVLWLQNNPITIPDDVAFVEDKVRVIKGLFEKLPASAKETSEGKSKWSGVAPHIRFMHCYVTIDKMREKFVEYQKCKNRIQLDGRHNTETQQEDFWQVVADLFNNSSYNPVSFIFPNLHEDFMEEIDITWNAVRNMGTLTREKAYSKHLTHSAALSKIKENYDRSGNGEGNRLTLDDDENGPGIALKISGGDTKASYLGGYESYILYFWQVCELFQFEKRVVQMIDNEYALDNGNIPSATVVNANTKRNKKRKAEKEAAAEARKKDDAFLEELKKSITATNLELAQHRLSGMKAEQHKVSEQLFEAEVIEIELIEKNASAARLKVQQRKIEYYKQKHSSLDADIAKFEEGQVRGKIVNNYRTEDSSRVINDIIEDSDSD